MFVFEYTEKDFPNFERALASSRPLHELAFALVLCTVYCKHFIFFYFATFLPLCKALGTHSNFHALADFHRIPSM